MTKWSITLDQAQQLARNVIEQAKYILTQFGPREPGSDSETRTQQYFAELLKPHADFVHIEPFQVAPMALLFFLPVTGIIIFFASAVLPRYPWLGCMGVLMAIAIAWFHFFRYHRVLDPFLPKRTSHNVFAIYRPKHGRVSQRIILCGHADSAYEMRYNQWGTIYIQIAVITLILSICTLLIISGLLVIETFHEEPFAFLPEPIRPFLIIPGIIYALVALTFVRFSYVVPGANDNLSGSLCAIEVFKWFCTHPLELQQTELWCLITGSEEAGLRGAYAFIEQHREALSSLPTVVIAVDTIEDIQHMGVVTRDLNGLLPHHNGVISLLYQSGLDLGLNLKPVVVYFGSTDATAFTKNKIPTSALVAMDSTPATYYHTRADNVDAMNLEALNYGIRILITAVKRYDLYGLPSNGPIPIPHRSKLYNKSPEKLTIQQGT